MHTANTAIAFVSAGTGLVRSDKLLMLSSSDKQFSQAAC